MGLDARGRLTAAVRIAVHPTQWRAHTMVRDRVFPSLRHAHYARLWQANVGSTTAFWMQSVAQGWLVIELTDSPFMLGLMAFFRSIPMLVLSPFGGVLADRLNRVRLLTVCQVTMGCTALTIGTLVATDRISVWHLAVASLALGTVFSVSMPTRNALVSDLVPRSDIGNAVGLNSATMNAARIVGPSLAGLLVGAVGIASCYFAQVGGYAWSTLNVARIRTGVTPARAQGSPLAMLRNGVVYVIHNKPILALLLLAMGPAVLSMPTISLLPAFVKQELGAGPQNLGVLMSALGVGALVGSMTVVTQSRFRFKGRALVVAAFVYGTLVVVLSITRSMPAAGAVIAAAGFFQAVYIAVNQTIIQLTVPGHFRGRVLSIYMISHGVTPLGLLPLSALAEAVDTATAMAVGGALSALVVLAVLAWGRELWSLQPDFQETTG